MSYIDCCDWSKCNSCGECLIKCPVMQMDRDEAKFEVSQLLKGKEAKRVFNECTLCFSCNNYCPVEGLRPHELIQQRMLEHRGKAPEYIKYFLNGMPTPTIWNDMYSNMNSEEKEILEKWSKTPSKSAEILWIGCVGKMSCRDIEHSEVLKSLHKFGPTDLCCGELAYRLGSWQAYSDTTERTLKRFEKLDIERMVCYCGSCYNYFHNILPNVYGKKLPFQLISLYQWMWERIEKGELKLKNPLNFKAAISESCYVSELGPEFWETLRKIYNAAGAELVELKHHGYENLFCGTISMARKGNFLSSFLEMYKEQRKKYEEVKDAGVNEMAVNCAGCYIMSSFTNYFHGIKLLYMTDELLMAYGDTITTPIRDHFIIIRKYIMKRMPRLLLHKSYEEFSRISIEGELRPS